MEIVERQQIVALTEAAAGKVKELLSGEPDDESSVLRVQIQGGGCSGFEYALGFDSGVQEGDLELESHGVRIVVDQFSAPYLRGATIDYLNTIQESGFKIENPNAVSSCGCGHSFQVDDADVDYGAAPGCGSGCAH